MRCCEAIYCFCTVYSCFCRISWQNGTVRVVMWSWKRCLLRLIVSMLEEIFILIFTWCLSWSVALPFLTEYTFFCCNRFDALLWDNLLFCSVYSCVRGTRGRNGNWCCNVELEYGALWSSWGVFAFLVFKFGIWLLGMTHLIGLICWKPASCLFVWKRK